MGVGELGKHGNCSWHHGLVVDGEIESRDVDLREENDWIAVSGVQDFDFEYFCDELGDLGSYSHGSSAASDYGDLFGAAFCHIGIVQEMSRIKREEGVSGRIQETVWCS